MKTISVDPTVFLERDMAPLSQTNWYHSNISSLLQEIDRVRNYLEKYIEGKENLQ
ncbi:MAG: hypothetical protein F6K65_39395, partial [Moorea sp. SIO3C2]|nr:hypothetical protein [Moorena sp. SIO3C2]